MPCDGIMHVIGRMFLSCLEIRSTTFLFLCMEFYFIFQIKA